MLDEVILKIQNNKDNELVLLFLLQIMMLQCKVNNLNRYSLYYYY
jgi:hypothetical protein